MSATRPLHVVRDPGPQGPWLEVLGHVEEALNQRLSYTVYDLGTKAIIGLVGMALGVFWTLFVLAALGEL